MLVQVGKLIRAGATSPELVTPEDGKYFTLPELQKYVGGFIELVPAGIPGVIVYCNEEGQLKGLRSNMLASVICEQHLVGDVILVRSERRHETKKAA